MLKDATGSFTLGFLSLGGVALLGFGAVVLLSRAAPVRRTIACAASSPRRISDGEQAPYDPSS